MESQEICKKAVVIASKGSSERLNRNAHNSLYFLYVKKKKGKTLHIFFDFLAVCNVVFVIYIP